MSHVSSKTAEIEERQTVGYDDYHALLLGFPFFVCTFASCTNQGIIRNMTYTIEGPHHIDTTIELPAAKSISNRALIIHALAGQQVMPLNLSDCDDTEVIVEALEKMPETINVKAAGTAMRFMTAYLSVGEGEHVITGTERM